MFDLSGHTALVTGAGQNAGAGIARALAAQGAAVAVNDLVPDRAEAVAAEIEKAGGTAVAAPFDVTDLAAVQAGVAAARGRLGHCIDILVHNAGIPADFGQGQFRTLDPSRWRAPVEINLFGAMKCVSTVLGDMCDNGWGRIIQISSGSARTGSDQGFSLYGSAKSGVEGFIRHISQAGAARFPSLIGRLACRGAGHGLQTHRVRSGRWRAINAPHLVERGRLVERPVPHRGGEQDESAA